ncbi:glycoprotein 3-alpha-L-fucosyltransferase A-like [Crassostrea virginica]
MITKMKSYLEGFVIAVFTIVSTIFFLGFFLSSSSPSNGSFTNIEPKIEGDDFIGDTGLGSEKLRVVNLVPRDSLQDTPAKKTWRILWYNIPFYLVPYVKNFQAKTCKNKKSNCLLTTDIKQFNMSDVVVFTHTSIPGRPPLKRKSQIWCFNSLETRAITHHPSNLWKDKFEWIMSYRRDADIVRPYGKIFRKKHLHGVQKNYTELFRQKTKFGVWMSSHCPVPSRRKAYIEELQKYVSVDTYGTCGKQKCGTRTNAISECLKTLSKEHKFYFSFENNICRDYTTEKLFNLYVHNLDIIPVINGPPQASQYLPKGTYLNTMDFSSPKALAETLQKIGSNETLYLQYLKEKDKYFALGEMEVFGESMCNVCEKLDQLGGKQIPTKPDFWEYQYNKEC